ncbi:MAG: hypothetical protein E7F68_06535 [Clostridium butyricum]|nr:hypothetical protein [Clostridium butyricum]MDU3594741.1 hypothetical protein [Clostridium butyricum]
MKGNFNGANYIWEMNREGINYLNKKYGDTNCQKAIIMNDYKEFCTNKKIDKMIICVEVYINSMGGKNFYIRSMLMDSKQRLCTSGFTKYSDKKGILIPVYMWNNADSINEEDLDLEFIKPVISELISLIALGGFNIWSVDKMQNYCDEMYKLCTEANAIEDGSIF